MARAADDASFFAELASPNLYKRNQGRLTRQLTAIAVALVFILGAWTLANTVLSEADRPVRLGIPLAIGLLGTWVGFRLVNYPRFADFLISVEAEMDKVSWPDWPYLIRATGVVLAVMILTAAYLFLFDTFWLWFFDLIGFLDITALRGE
jgi:preprotein translocase subunit SecE